MNSRWHHRKPVFPLNGPHCRAPTSTVKKLKLYIKTHCKRLSTMSGKLNSFIHSWNLLVGIYFNHSFHPHCIIILHRTFFMWYRTIGNQPIHLGRKIINPYGGRPYYTAKNTFLYIEYKALFWTVLLLMHFSFLISFYNWAKNYKLISYIPEPGKLSSHLFVQPSSETKLWGISRIKNMSWRNDRIFLDENKESIWALPTGLRLEKATL